MMTRMFNDRFTLIGLALLLAACSGTAQDALRPSPQPAGSLSSSPSASVSPSPQPKLTPSPTGGRPPTPKKAAAPQRKPSHGFVMPRFSRVVIIVLENKEYEVIIGSDRAPYLNSLANTYALATQFHGVTHPSLPNYIAMTSGGTNGITSNCTNCHTSATNIVTQMERAGISWKGYMEGIPGPCSDVAESSDGLYAKKHNPFMYYDDIRNNPSRCNKVVPLTHLDTDIQNGTLPQFVWVTPNMCHDMHDCRVSEGDAWMSKFVPKLLDTLGPRGVLFVTFDEGNTNAGCCTYAAGGRIATIIAGPAARTHTSSSVRMSLYSLLRTIEDSWRLGRLGHAGCSCTADMRTLLHSA
jgi:hypothetical protein